MGALGHVPWASTRDVNTHAFVQAGWEIYDAAALVTERRSAMGIPSNASGDHRVFMDHVHLLPHFNRVLAQHVERHLIGCKHLHR